MWTERMSGMVITRAFTANKQPMSILIGRLQDQAALAGVMNALYSLHLVHRLIELPLSPRNLTYRTKRNQ